jgi:hypothetical protein
LEVDKPFESTVIVCVMFCLWQTNFNKAGAITTHNSTIQECIANHCRLYLHLLNQFTVGFIIWNVPAPIFTMEFYQISKWFGIKCLFFLSRCIFCQLLLFSLRQLLVCPLYFLAGL